MVIVFFVSTIDDAEFLIYINNDSKVIWDLLPTIPCLCLLIEYPFNMIPFDWPMLILVEIIFSIYILVNFLVVAADENHNYIYSSFDWYGSPLRAFGALFICYIILAVIFAVIWAITNMVKLPRYGEISTQRFDSQWSRSNAN